MSLFRAMGFDQDFRQGSDGQLAEDSFTLPASGSNRSQEYSPISQVPETVGVAPFPGVELPAQNAMSDLLFLRSEFPFLPIMPFPHRTISRVMTANVPQEIPVPDGCMMGLIQGTADYYVSRHGAASVPATTNTAGSMQTQDNAEEALFRPEFAFFYLNGVSAFSVVAPTTGTIVQMAFWKTSNWARRLR
jgi:hypothetical protein